MIIKITDEYLYEIMPKVEQQMLDEYLNRTELPFEPSRQFEKKIKRLIKKSKRPKRYHAVHSNLSRVAVLALVIIGIGIALAASVQATEGLRMKIKEQIFQEDAVVERFEINGEGIMKYMTHIPDGYKLVEEQPDNYMAVYEDEKGNIIKFYVRELDSSSVVLKDTEFKNETGVMVDDREVLIGIKEDGTVRSYWYDDNMFYIIMADALSEEALVEIIKNIK